MKMINWHVRAWDDYLYWQISDRRIVKRINVLIKDILRKEYTQAEDGRFWQSLLQWRHRTGQGPGFPPQTWKKEQGYCIPGFLLSALRQLWLQYCFR
ncbi:MAG TPA: hypothetical protein ENK58_07215 [Desulfobacterales bacterium]|nr:hypothetical protein [Desulfobacterales bacterium]